jgi:type I restriction enzyme, S subunit
MTKKSDAPAIRFKGFSDAWEQRKLSEITDKVTEKNAGLQYVETFTNSAEFGIISQRDFFDHDIAKLGSLDGYYIVKNEDFVYNPRISTTAPVGPINRNKLGRTGVMSPLYTVFRPHDIDTTYLEYFFKCGYWHSFMNFNGDSGARSDRFSIRDNVFFQMPIPIPDIDEQRKIGELLTCLDNLITLHQRKFEKLTNVKKSMLEKMFPQNGSSYPEIRFKGFTDPWEQRKLGDIGETYTGLSGKTKADFGHGQARFVTYMNVFSNPISNPEMTEPIEIDPKQNEVEVGDVLFTTSSETPEEVGMSSVLLEKRGKTYLNSFCFGFRPSEKIDSYYLAYMLRSESTREKIILLAQGISRYNISKNKVMEIAVSLPSLDEQKLIGQYFRQLDNLITLHQRELEKLQNIKKSMLEKMFV